MDEAIRGFHHTGAAWYASTAARPGVLDEILLGRHCRDGGCLYEWAIRWHEHPSGPTARIEIYQESWQALSDMADVLAALGADPAALTVEDAVALLRDCGLHDLTAYEMQS